MKQKSVVCATRKEFVFGLTATATGALIGAAPEWPALNTHDLDVWQKATDAVRPDLYQRYLAGTFPAADNDVLTRLEAGFDRVLAEIKSTPVGDEPAVWLVYNMGVVVKTRESLFSIDFVHRRALELAPQLDFALITHNHGDHYRHDFYRTLDRAGKTVINNFIDNYGAADWRKGGKDWAARGGFTRAEKIFRIKDVEIRTSLTDHNNYLVDYTTAFEIRVGKWRMFHTGDCSNVEKLNPIWGRPDLWVVFPGCGIDIAAGARKIQPAKMAFGHLWELGHDKGRLTTPMVKKALAKVKAATGLEATVPLWGERITPNLAD